MESVKLRIKDIRITVTLEYIGDRIFIHAPYHKGLIDEIKSMEGAKWHGFEEVNPRKVWSISDSQRNQFQLAHLLEKNPYARFDKSVDDIKVTSPRPLYNHQIEMVQNGIGRNVQLFACEMGTGKTLAVIEILEALRGEPYLSKIGNLSKEDLYYIGPRAGVRAVDLELKKWETPIQITMLTYEGLVKKLRQIIEVIAPRVIILDESSKIKTPTSQRSQAVRHLTDASRKEWGEKSFIFALTGTPSPKSPIDWWHQCEVLCPGFIKEGNIAKFKMKLSLIEERQSITGGVYPHLVTWLDDENKCTICGQFKEHQNHIPIMVTEDIIQKFGQEGLVGVLNDKFHVPNTDFHDFKKSVNEVARLAKRLKGLVYIKFKKDCADLPEKQYKLINIPPSAEILRTAKLITKTSARTIEALTLLRELSDGFQYVQVQDGEELCPNCKGRKEIEQKELVEQDIEKPSSKIQESDFKNQLSECLFCKGKGLINKFRRDVKLVDCPKDDIFIELLDEHEEIGRFIVWGGFTGTIDKLVGICHKYGWSTLRVDGRGFVASDAMGNSLESQELLMAMDASYKNYNVLLEKYPKICFVGHPRAGGMALTLTGSPTELFYSNDFSGEARFQAEDRFHRIGMDKNRGATIIDLIHLSTDRLVLDNLQKKKDLQALSLGQLLDFMEGE